MKKIFNLFIIILLLFIFVGCEQSIDDPIHVPPTICPEYNLVKITGDIDAVLNKKEVETEHLTSETVCIKIAFDINAKVYYSYDSAKNYTELDKTTDGLYWYYSFKMPNTDVIVLIDKIEEETITSPNFLGKESVTFYPSPSSTPCEEFEELFKNSKFYNEGMGNTSIVNHTPKDIHLEYNVGFYSVLYSGDNTVYYLSYGNNVVSVSPFSYNSNTNNGFVHFAITDFNKDGYMEILCSFNVNAQRTNSSFCNTYITIFDTKTNNSFDLSTIYNAFAFFKNDKNGNIAIYESKTKNINTANVLYSSFVTNNLKYIFNEKELFLKSDNYEVNIIIDENTVNFPFICKGMSLGFKVSTKMKWLGETFMYTNGTATLAGATAVFKNGNNVISMEPEGGYTVVTKFVIFTNMEIEKNYTYHIYFDEFYDSGLYDLIIDYRGEIIIVEDFLTIK